MNKINFDDAHDYGGGFDASDSEADYSEDEKRLLRAVRKARGKKQDSKNEVFAFDDDDEVDEDIELADSDIEGKGEYDEEDGVPDSKAWGSSKKSFYHTDFVDKDYSSYNAQEEEEAKQEEEEARNIQKRLAKELDEADFFLDTFQEPPIDESKVESKTKVKNDYSNLSKAQKLELFHKENPEFRPLFDDFNKFSEEKAEVLDPVLKYACEMNLDIPIIGFVRARSKIVNLYLLNLSFYFVLKSKKQSIRNHPVAKVLAQYKKLLNELQPKFEELICPELMKLFPYIDNGEVLEIDEDYYKDKTLLKEGNVSKSKEKKSKLGIMKTLENKAIADDESDSSDNDDTNLPIIEGTKLPIIEGKMSDSEDSEKEQVEADEEDNNSDEKRAITYQMAKNKGLMPSRKKEVRNPRVKNKLKYRKANIRRKGAVRTVRKELSRYTGEMSGIKATVKKGIKIRS